MQAKKVFSHEIFVFCAIWHIVICATFCVSFPSKSKAINVFPEHILKSKARDKSIQARKKLFCHVIVRNYLCNVLCKFLIKFESTWKREFKKQIPQLTLLYCGRTFRSRHGRFFIKELFLKILQYPQKNLGWSLFFKNKQLFKKETPAQVFSCEYCRIFKTTCFEKHPQTADFWLFQWFTVAWA